MQSVINNIERSYQKGQNGYNPAKYIRGAKLLDGNKTNYSEVMIKKDGNQKKEFTYEDYKNSLKEKNGNTGTNLHQTTLQPQINTVNIDNNINANPYSYESYIKQRNTSQIVNPNVSKEDLTNSNTDYVLNNMMKPKSNTVTNNDNYLNFEVKKEVTVTNTNDLRTQFQQPPEENVFNPYASLGLSEFKPVYKTTMQGNVPNDFNNFNNNFSNFNNNYNNMNNNVNQLNNNMNNLNNNFNTVNNTFSGNNSNPYNNTNPSNNPYKK
jgi:hypothetical protein